MSDFQDGFFRDLWYDTLLNGPRSILFGYFREEKRQHTLVTAKKREYERTAVCGPCQAGLEEERQYTGDGAGRSRTAAGRARKSMGEHACVELLCEYYALCAGLEPGRLAGADAGREMAAFLAALDQKTDAVKCSRRRKDRAAEAVRAVRDRLRAPEKRLREALDRAVMCVADLYLYVEAAQFLYNAGYPLPPEEDDGEYGREIRPPRKKDRARIKTVPLRLLDYYFGRRGLSMGELVSVSRMPPSGIARSEELKEKLEEVYEFACDNEMDRAVIPLLIDNASGSGLYVLGENYLKSWERSGRLAAQVERILDGRPCCYAIVRFLNLELEDGGSYFWAPYSVTDPVYGKGYTNPESVLFGDLETALNIYQGQLNAMSMEVLYENYRSENVVDLPEEEIPVDPQFRKYFQAKPEALDAEIADIRDEYQKKKKGWEKSNE